MTPAEAGRGPAWLLLVIWVAATLAAALYAAGWATDNRLSNWVAQLGEDPAYRALVEEFGGDEALVVRVSRANRANRANRIGPAETAPLTAADTRSLTGLLRTLAAVAEVFDPLEGLLAGTGAAVGTGGPGLDPSGPLNRALDLVDPRAGRADLVVRVRPEATPGERAELAAVLDEARTRSAAAGLAVVAAGHPLLAAALDAEAARVEEVFAPLLVLLTALGLAVLLRSWALALLTVLPAIWASSTARAALRAAGIDSDLILVDVGPLSFVLVTASSLHLVSAFRRRLANGAAPEAAARGARAEKLVAGLLAAGTTAVGFGVFAASGLRSVALLGGTVAGTMLLCLPFQYLLLPRLLGGLPLRRPRAGPNPLVRSGPHRSHAPWRRLALWAVRRRFAVIAVSLTLLIGGAIAGASLREETNALHYFPRGHQVRSDFRAIEDSGGALSAVEVLARPTDGASWSLEALAEETLGARLSATEGARGALGPALVAAELEDSLGLLGRPLLEPALERSGRLDGEHRWARWTVRFPTGGTDETRAFAERIEGVVEAWAVASGAEAVVTGSIPLVLRMQERLVGALARSLAWTALATALCLLSVSRDPRVILAAALSNLVPVAVVLASAALGGLALDSATVMVGAVVLGLAVDNTLHLLHAGRGPRRSARLAAFDRVGPAAAASSLALAAGFASLAQADFAPVARFGLLCALGALAALFADLVVLPALWIRPTSRPDSRSA